MGQRHADEDSCCYHGEREGGKKARFMEGNGVKLRPLGLPFDKEKKELVAKRSARPQKLRLVFLSDDDTFFPSKHFTLLA